MRLIDADALMERMTKAMEGGSNLNGTFHLHIEHAPTADAVEVVRCKDCRHRDLFSCPLTDNDFQKDEDYCSWGERKGGDSDG